MRRWFPCTAVWFNLSIVTYFSPLFHAWLLKQASYRCQPTHKAHGITSSQCEIYRWQGLIAYNIFSEFWGYLGQSKGDHMFVSTKHCTIFIKAKECIKWLQSFFLNIMLLYIEDKIISCCCYTVHTCLLVSFQRHPPLITHISIIITLILTCVPLLILLELSVDVGNIV